MSAATAPMFNLAAYNTAPPELQGRARQLGSLVARVSPGTVGLSGFRQQLDTFFGSYIAELQDRGLPIWHPLPLQVPDDLEPRASGHHHVHERDVRRERLADLFRLGDALGLGELVVPDERDAHQLPQGGLVVADQHPDRHTTSLNTSSSRTVGERLSEVAVSVPLTLSYSPVPPTTGSA